MAIVGHLEESLILFLNASSRNEALQSLVERLEREGKLQSAQQFYQAVLEREQIVSTGIGLGVAIPHAKLSGYSEFFIAVGIQQGPGLDWGALDGCDVHFIFLIGGPDCQQTQYLNLLSHLTLAIKQEQRRKKLLRAKTPREVISLFAGC